MNKPLLHVVIPAYGQSPYLKETLLSATRKLAANVPITVLEDPSESNNVREVVSDFLGRVDYQINSSRLGIGGNFNKAIEISTGVYTLLCGSDDLITGDISQYLTNIDHDFAAITSNCIVIDKYGKKIHPLADLIKSLIKPKKVGSYQYQNKNFFNRLLIGDWLYFPSTLWNTEIIKREKFNNDFHTAMDLDIFVRLVSKKYRIFHIAASEFAYRRHSESASSLYALDSGRFYEELRCHKTAAQLAKEENWFLARLLAHLAFTVRIHAILKALALVTRLKFRAAGKLIVISLTPLTSSRL